MSGTRLFVLALVPSIAIVICAATGTLLSRIDRATALARDAHAIATQSRDAIAALHRQRNAIVEHVNVHAAELALCRKRTDHLRLALDVLVRSNPSWPERVELPGAIGLRWPEWEARVPQGVGDAR